MNEEIKGSMGRITGKIGDTPSCQKCNDTGEVDFPFSEGKVNCIDCNASMRKEWREAVAKAALRARTGSVLICSRVILEIDRLLNATA